NGGNNSREVRIPWDDITAGNGRPASFNWFGYLISNDNKTYGSVPRTRANLQSDTILRDPWYFAVDGTDDSSSTFPFHNHCFTFLENFDSYIDLPSINPGTFADLTLNRPNL